MKTIIVPDSFKGTMSAIEFCEIASRALHSADPEAVTVSIPVADGGEGTVESFLAALGGERVALTVTGPLGEKTESFYGLLPDGTAVVEMAAAAGLPMVKGRENPLITTTYGVGELIYDALSRCRRLIIGLGGSATNDGGCGLAAALGVKFFDADGREFVPAGGTLSQISRILGPADMRGVPVTIMCDINNPLCGELGAAAVFGPQKGASPDDVRLLDDGLRHLAEIVRRDLHADILEIPGAGAAGGMGGGLSAFLGGELKMGIETVLDTVDFADLLRDADLVVTGEGRIDGQSARGKVVYGVARRAKAQGVPVIAVVGDVGAGAEQLYDHGLTAIFSINRVCVPLAEARPRSRADLESTVSDIARFAKAMAKPAKIHDSVTGLIGNTPLLRLAGKHPADILLKLERFNPAGSAKDRIGLSLIRDAEERGLLAPGGTIIEPTSGNTGIALAAFARARGYRVILTMPDTMSEERRSLLRAYGAELVLTEGALGMAGAAETAEALRRAIPDSYIPGQFNNPANAEAHYRTTGPEIWRDTVGKIDIFVATIGTGGTITGAGRYLKERSPAVKVVGVEPAESPLITEGRAGSHGIQGIGANFVPEVLDLSVVDEILTVKTEDALSEARALPAADGLLCGLSSGAALRAAKALAARPENAGKTIVALLPDTGERYLSVL